MRKLHREESHDFYSSTNIIRAIKLMRVQLVGSVAYVEI